jgi:hypothetical protein
MPPIAYKERAQTALARTTKQLSAARSKVRAIKKAAEAPSAVAFTVGGVSGGAALAGVLVVEAPTVAGLDSRLIAGLLLVSLAAVSRGPSASLVANVGAGLLAGYVQDLTVQSLDPQ